MDRRGFLTTCASLLPLPAFVRAASLWLPKERPFVKPAIWTFEDGPCRECRIDTAIMHTYRPFTPEERAMVDELMRKVWGPAIEAQLMEHTRILGLTAP